MIDKAGFAGAGRAFGQALVLSQAVDEGGFTDVGTAYQGKFGAIGRRKLVHADSAG